MDPSARIGTTLRGKWRLDRLLGTGGFAAVYAATHRAGKRVAIKVLHPALNASADVRRRFLKEAYAANAVDHPGVVAVSDDDVTDDGAAFLVMDLLEGETVEARRKRAGGHLEIAAVLDIAGQALDALAAAHEKGIVHRDLKPENLFLTTTGQVKILDFGIARFREPGEDDTATQTGLTMGSPAFMAPEQARGRWSEVDARTDVYALGATMFTLLSGQLVHGKGNMNATLVAAATCPAPPLASLMPHVPPAIALVVDRAVAFDRETRWPDARSMRAAVEAARQRPTDATGTLPLTAAPALGSNVTLPTQPLTPPGAFTAVSGSSVSTSSSPVSAPVTGPTAVPVPPVVPAAPARDRARATPLAVALVATAVCAAAVTLWWVTRAPAAAGDFAPMPISVPLPEPTRSSPAKAPSTSTPAANVSPAGPVSADPAPAAPPPPPSGKDAPPSPNKPTPTRPVTVVATGSPAPKSTTTTAPTTAAPPKPVTKTAPPAKPTARPNVLDEYY